MGSDKALFDRRNPVKECFRTAERKIRRERSLNQATLVVVDFSGDCGCLTWLDFPSSHFDRCWFFCSIPATLLLPLLSIIKLSYPHVTLAFILVEGYGKRWWEFCKKTRAASVFQLTKHVKYQRAAHQFSPSQIVYYFFEFGCMR